LGRPKRIFDREKAITLAQNMSLRQVARELGVSRGVIERALSRSNSNYREWGLSGTETARLVNR
jgi:hypothetical protein